MQLRRLAAGAQAPGRCGSARLGQGQAQAGRGWAGMGCLVLLRWPLFARDTYGRSRSARGCERRRPMPTHPCGFHTRRRGRGRSYEDVDLRNSP
eukprot:scaffold966_cov415-Prasinococcus_capsulatus_cf.AAC.10